MSEIGTSAPIRVLFASDPDSVCPQIAEGWLRLLGGDLFDIDCTGGQPSGGLSPEAVATMAEAGISLSRIRPAPLVSFRGQHFDFVISIGERPAQEANSVEALEQRLFWPIEEPLTGQQSAVGRAAGLRRAREAIRGQVVGFVLDNPPALFRLLGDRITWRSLDRLARSDQKLSELATANQVAESAVQERLRRLQGLGLVRERLSDHDLAITYYSLDLDRLRGALQGTFAQLHPALWERGDEQPAAADQFRPVRILFLCTENSARSQMAEGIAHHISRGIFEPYSAGSQPSPVHPDAVRVCLESDIDISRQEPKHLEAFLNKSFDYIVTVCDRQRETCPVYPGDPERIHWSIPDPTKVEDPQERYRAFRDVANLLLNRIRLLLLFVERDRREREAAIRARNSQPIETSGAVGGRLPITVPGEDNRTVGRGA